MSSDASQEPLPGAVLFACNFNQVRSPMAEALLKLVVGTSVYVDSCGLKRAPLLNEDDEDGPADRPPGDSGEHGVDPRRAGGSAERRGERTRGHS